MMRTEPCWAQRGRPSATPQHQAPAAPAAQQRRQDRPPQQRQQEKTPAPQERRQGGGAENPRRGNGNAPDSVQRPNFNPNRPPSTYTPPAPRRFSDLSPADRQKVLENNRKYQNLSATQKQEMQERIDTWNRLTPTQQNHIRNDVLPKWKEMPQDRRSAIRQKLRILQNMPESARNQRLNDPNFTKGMSEEDKATLRDLSHMHVGAPDPPGE